MSSTECKVSRSVNFYKLIFVLFFRRVYISYLDSVHYFRPKQKRTALYFEILIGYLEHVKQLGFSYAHIWACPPSEGDDYIFHCHPAEQRVPKPKRLQEWYKTMLDIALAQRIIVDYKVCLFLIRFFSLN
jgi:E1A/CREB-binding protein